MQRLHSQKRLQLYREEGVYDVGFCLTTASLEDLVAKSAAFLHPKERAYFDGLAFPKRQHSYLLGRFAAKEAIGSHRKYTAPTAVLIENGVFQQPFISHPHLGSIQLSISHSGCFGAALCFPESLPMAIDVEVLDESKRATLEAQVSQKERSFCPNTELPLLTMLWAAKEALSKVLRCGFMMSLELLEVAKITTNGMQVTFEFIHFYQYQAIAFSVEGAVCAIIYPKKTTFVL